MAKHAKQEDMFGMGAEDEGPQDAPDDAEYVILQVISAEGWRAVFRDPDTGGTPTRILGVAGFALIEVVPQTPVAAAPPMRAMRPMVATEHGEVEDVATFEDFICVVPPGEDVDAAVGYATRHPAEDK